MGLGLHMRKTNTEEVDKGFKSEKENQNRRKRIWREVIKEAQRRESQQHKHHNAKRRSEEKLASIEFTQSYMVILAQTYVPERRDEFRSKKEVRSK